jgi:Fe-S-cluster containining protein
MDCAGCGDCCDPVWLPYGEEILAGAQAMNAPGRSSSLGEDAQWVVDHMKPLALQPVARPGAAADATAWACDALDPVTRVCTAHELRPPMCRGYPWYGRPAGRNADALLPGCSHHWDLEPGSRGELSGRLLPLWPVGADVPSAPL